MDDVDLDRLDAIEWRQAEVTLELDELGREGAELELLASTGQFSTSRLRAFRQRSAELEAKIAGILDELDTIERKM